MKKFFVAFMIVVVMGVAFGMGENYLAQQELADRADTAVRREELAELYEEMFAEYNKVVDGDYHLHIDSVDENGISVTVKGWDQYGDRWTNSGTIPWSEVTEALDMMDAEIKAAKYSF